MKICILTHTFPRFKGDAISSIFMERVAQSLVDAGNEVWVLTPYTPLFKNEKRDFKVKTYKYIFPDSLHKLGYSETLTNDMGFPLLFWFLSPFMYFSAFFALLKLVKKEKIEIINAHWILPNGFIAGFVSLFTGIPVVSTLPGSDVYMAGKNPFFNLMARIAELLSRWITSNSPQLIDDLAKLTRKSVKEKSTPIIYSVGSDKFKPDPRIGAQTRSELGIGKEELVILGVGRLVAKKGFKYLIQAAPKIITRNKKTKFVIIGDGDQKGSLVALTKKLKVAYHFQFLGIIPYTRMNAFYNMADIFILPSIRDEKGNLDDQSVAVSDAMACAKPVITSDFPGYRLIIRNGENGILVKEKDTEGITSSIIRLIESPALRLKMGNKAFKSMTKEFSWRSVGIKYTELFKAITSNYYSIGVPKILSEPGRERIAKQIWGILKNEVKNPKKKRVLDLACSSGVISNYLASHFKTVHAVDSDGYALELAKNEFAATRNLKFQRMDGLSLKFKNNSFDVVICNQVYNFVDDPQRLVDEIYRVLKPGGVCFFGARNRLSLIEPQYGIPFISLFPSILPFGKKYMYIWQIKKLLSNFTIYDYTLKVLNNPNKYGFKKVAKYSSILRLLPLNLLYPVIPNYLLILRKIIV